MNIFKSFVEVVKNVLVEQKIENDKSAIPDFDKLTAEDFKKAGVDNRTKDILFESEGTCKQIIAQIYNKISKKLGGIINRLKDEKISEKVYSVAKQEGKPEEERLF